MCIVAHAVSGCHRARITAGFNAGIGWVRSGWETLGRREMHSAAPTRAYLAQPADISDKAIVMRLCLPDSDIPIRARCTAIRANLIVNSRNEIFPQNEIARFTFLHAMYAHLRADSFFFFILPTILTIEPFALFLFLFTDTDFIIVIHFLLRFNKQL